MKFLVFIDTEEETFVVPETNISIIDTDIEDPNIFWVHLTDECENAIGSMLIKVTKPNLINALASAHVAGDSDWRDSPLSEVHRA